MEPKKRYPLMEYRDGVPVSIRVMSSRRKARQALVNFEADNPGGERIQDGYRLSDGRLLRFVAVPLDCPMPAVI